MCWTPSHYNAVRLTIMAAAMALIALVIVALACGPSAPAGQDEPAPEPTATAEPTAAPTDESSDANDSLPPPPTRTQLERQYPNLDGNLIQKIEQHEAASGAGGASGSSDQPTPTPELIDLIIFLDTADRTDEIQNFLEDNNVSRINCVKGRSDSLVKGSCGATVPVSLLRSLAEQSGVLRIEKALPTWPASNLPSPSSQQTPADAHGAIAWRLAGADGAGVKVGIIDYGFKDFRTRLPNLTPAAQPFGYDTSGNLVKANISV